MFRVNIGAKDNADPRWLLPLICRRGGVISKDVGAIRVGPNETIFEISGDAARDFALSAAERDPRAPHVTFEPANKPGHPVDSRDRDTRERRPTVHPRPARTQAPPAIIDRPGQAHSATQRPSQSADRPPAARAAQMRPERAAEPHPASRPEQGKKPHAPPIADKSLRATTPATRAQAPSKSPTTAPAAFPPAFVAPTSPPQPASIFQTRTPEPEAPHAIRTNAAPSERARREKPHAPVIEVKRASRVGPHGMRPTSERVGPTFSRGPAPERPRTDGTNLVRRSSSANGPRGEAGGPAAPPSQLAARVSPPGRPMYPARPASGPVRPPFWKDGARKRPAPPKRRHDGHAPTDKPARR